ncbi:hypothetical protein [Xiashengella succiniciproducens]|jgi:hypothetical protein|uniref:Uncharacterized protein n=1 Tax=Xiashengella succiniciproducens TaxID=2949635 RepID=A0A9J6ZPM2_9BACT|nr:hypothetical protein [Alkaliflexus sp. Ai-910]URW79579.1 hypothetical protein M9189_12025 [Alkaliflexus sp. Ai-910]
MKILILFAVCVLCSCSKDSNDFAVEEQYDSELSADEALLKSQLSKAASVLSRLTSISEVDEELKSIGNTFEVADSSFSLKEILTQEPVLKSTEDKFANLRACFYKNRDLKSVSPIDSLLSSIIDYDYVMWMPYPLEWYPDDRQFLTIVSHPLDNEVEGIGYRWINGKLEEVLVNDDYNEEYPVLIVTPKYLAGDDLNLNLSSSLKSSVGDEILQVRIGEFRTRSKFGTGFFKKNVTFEIHRGQGEVNADGKTITTSWPTKIGFNVSKKHIKAAKKGWTKYKNGGWVSVNVLWDYNWKKGKTEQGLVLVCTSGSDKKETVTVSVSANEKGDISATIKEETKLEVKGKVVGNATIDRDGFLKMNKSHYEMRGAWAVHSVHGDVKFTMPHSLN